MVLLVTKSYKFHKELSKFFKPGDCIITETGTSAYGIVESKFPPGVIQFNQTVYGSIGYATGAAVGAFQAIKETGEFKRGVLITGEGSLQLTVQAISDMLRHGLKNVMYVSNYVGSRLELKGWRKGDVLTPFSLR